MSRKIRAGDAKLLSKTARETLKPSRKPYYRLIERGMSLGYRKPRRGPGTWVLRRYIGHDRYTITNLRTEDDRPIFADDREDANGKTILDFWQAQEAARGPGSERAAGPLTVKQAVESYLKSKEDHGRDIVDARCRAAAHIYPTLGDVECSKLTTEMLRDWHVALAKTLPRMRTKPGKEQQYRAFSGDNDAVRRRQASANRVMTTLKAALNLAFGEGDITSDIAWRKVKRFRGVESSRVRYLTVAEAKRLLNACDPDFRRLVQAALQTGARYGQLAALVVSDFNPDAGTVRMTTRKGDGNLKQYHVTLTAEGTSFFVELCAGRAGSELMLRNAARKVRTLDDNCQWRESEQNRPMVEACRRAKLDPPIGFHGLRHTWASLAVMNGVPLLIVAKNLGHADTRMVEKHYGHLSQSYVTDAIRAGAPTFGFKPDKKIATITR